MTFAHHILSTMDIKASAPAAPADSKPDELMINWATLPTASTASLFLPSVDADDLIATAASRYGHQPFTRIDAHTVSCSAQGVTFVPIPPASGNIASFIDVALPHTVQPGDKLTVAVSQITSAQGTIPTNIDPALPPAHDRLHSTVITWRKVAGTFQLALKVASKTDTLPIAERDLSLLRWIFAAMPLTSRWYPIFARYLTALASQISELGGDPADIPPSATGTWPGQPPVPHRHGEHNLTGKIEGLIYDHFGDFEGFILETDDGRTFRFFSREGPLQDVIHHAWEERLRLTVTPEDHDEHHPNRVVLHPTPHTP